jgi:phosphohistidine phosphatase
MRRLLLFRHSKAERAIPGGDDHSRTLNERGRNDAAIIGAYMAGHGLIPERVLVSTATRTQETWKYAGAAFKPVPSARSEARLYDASATTILDVIKGAQANAHTLLVIGHNPGIHELAMGLVATGDVDTRERLREKFPTSGLAIIDFAFDEWSKVHTRGGRLERFVSPKSLEAATN